MSPSRALTRESLGAWVLKASPTEPTVDELVRRGFSTDWTSCLRPTYRAGLVEPGQPVLLWVSGRSPATPAGIHAQGTITGVPAYDESGLSVPLRLEPVESPVPRADLLAHPVLSRIEVLRMPAGSNPSYLTREQVVALMDEWPHLTIDR